MLPVMNARPDFNKLEEETLKFWEEKDIFEKLRKKNKGKTKWSFLDGPITANNPMGVHHAWGRTYKDVFQRYFAMRGFDQRFQNGFDCQGLWIEVEVEKELGFKSKKDIEKYGIEEFVNACKARVLKYSGIQTQQSIRLGQWMDWPNSYLTMSDENNYAIWDFLKICWKKGYLYKGHDVVPWCPRCGTAISQHEILTEEYQELVHKSIYFRVPVNTKERVYFLVWTTTPWTLPANVALAVHPDMTYVQIKAKDGNEYILLEGKTDLIPEGQVVKTFLGKDLESYEYQGLFDELPAVQEAMGGNSHRVVMWDEVSEEEGTGIVHIAPGCGQEDIKLGKEYDLPVVNPTDDESRYPEGFDFLTGKLVTGIEEEIFEYLEDKGYVFKIEEYRHRYPTCWRCKSDLIFRLVDEWYISMEDLRPKLEKVAKGMNWIPSFGLDRELDWLKNMSDWMISKKRYWGLALPIFECEECNNFEVIGSKEELRDRAVDGWKDFEGHSPHRPWVDKVKIKCSECGSTVSRVTDVGTPWLDAGIVPFSTMGYFSDKEYWQKWFPAELVCESFPGQFKNWFYSLIVMSTVLENTFPVKTVFGYALVRDEQGEEMHKSKGNAIWFDEALEKLGADVMRWMYVKQNITNNLRFGYKLVEEHRRKLITLWNCHKFVYDRINREGWKLSIDTKNAKLSVLDRWILSRLNSLTKTVTLSLDNFDAFTASKEIEKFIDDFSLWYIRRSRTRVDHIGDEDDKKAFFTTSSLVLITLDKLMAPMTPFLSENLYKNLTSNNYSESVHLEDWPSYDEKLIDNSLGDQMDIVRHSVEKGHAKRKELKIRVRQPLSSVSFAGPSLFGIEENDDLIELIKEELNVKIVNFNLSEDLEDISAEFDTKLTPKLVEEGRARELIRTIQTLRKKAGCKMTEEIEVIAPDWPALYEKEIMRRTLAKSLSKGTDLKIERFSGGK